MDDFDEEEDSVYSLSNEDTETDTCSEMKTAKSIPRSMNKGFNTLLALFHHLGCFM